MLRPVGRLLACRVAVLQRIDTEVLDDGPDPPADVPRLAGVTAWVEVAGADAVAGAEAGRKVKVEQAEAQRPAPGRGQHFRSRGVRVGVTRLEFGLREKAAAQQSAGHHVEPPLVVRHPQVLVRRNAFEGEAEPRPVAPAAPSPHGPGKREDPAFPTVVKDRLVVLRLHRAEAVHAAHVVDRVHRPPPEDDRAATRATPIIESRVTRSANSSSVMSSVPGGRCGSTR